MTIKLVAIISVFTCIIVLILTNIILDYKKEVKQKVQVELRKKLKNIDMRW